MSLNPDRHKIDEMIHNMPNLIDLNGATILVTGGSGSFGQRFLRRTLELYTPRRIVIFSRDEHKQYDIEAMLMADPLLREKRQCVRLFIGDVRDAGRLTMAMRDVEYVVHAAALKHVPIAEYNPFECINTNVIGAENVVSAAINAGVKRVIALSTDKAANPVNLYGASKLASDKIMIAGNSLSGATGTRFSIVRYGNVVGSRGSVVPLFRRLIAQGATRLPITDPRMTRFWITLRQGVDFVLSSLNDMNGGEIFVPKIPSMRITDLATCMAPNLPHDIVGIRPGEKLHEIMITEDDARHTIEEQDRYVILPEFVTWTDKQEKSGKPLPEGFTYSSGNNQEWLTQQQLKNMMNED